MRLFEIDDASLTVMLNKPWILLIPEFAEIWRADKGSAGDTQARKKLYAFKLFTFIYFYKDFSSPLRSWEDSERYKEALLYSELEDKDIKNDRVKAALDKYEQLMQGASRSLRTLRSIEKGMDALDTYFSAIDFSLKDKDGRLLNDPNKFVNSVGTLNKMYDEFNKFEARVEADLSENGQTIRGKNELGENENKVRAWSEDDIREASPISKDAVRGEKLPEKGEGTFMHLEDLVPKEDKN